ncbi:hypothetical protein M3568_06060 [Priestia flexa]|nr:hypothetical protein [Priestia flexa]MCM3065998.1 hypothetical protein [Priestia flexa]
MMNEKDLDMMTIEERKVIDKLKMEMLNAVSLHDLRFYKQEIQRIKEQAKKRHGFFKTLQVAAEKL